MTRGFDGNDQQAVRELLREFQDCLSRELESAVAQRGESIARQIADITADAKRQPEAKRHLKQPEAAFLNTWVARALASTLRQRLGPDAARAALKAESYASIPEIASGPAARPAPYPFTKAMNMAARDVYKRRAAKKGARFPTCWPDLAITAPHHIVIEGKFFAGGSRDYAQRQLVAAIHEALFYLGIPAIHKNERSWGYHYGCLVAFDASKSRSFLSAWDDLQAEDLFWENSNLYVAILSTAEARTSEAGSERASLEIV